MTYLQHRAILLFGAMFVLYAGVSISWSLGNPFWAAAFLASIVGAFAFGWQIKNDKFVWKLFISFLLANMTIQLFLPLPYGLFGNQNYLGCALALGIAAAILFEWWWFVPLAIIDLLVLQARGALAAAGLAIVIRVWKWDRRSAAIIAAAAVAAVVIASAEREGSTFQRLGIWQDTLNHLTVFGSGWGSFFESYKSWPNHTNMTMVFASHAYNDVLELIFELGIGVIPLWIVLALACEVQSPYRLIMLIFGVLSLTYFPFFVPLVGHLFAFSLGHLAARHQPQAKGASYALST